MLKTGMIIAERYQIAGKIGTGGMADVYKAKDQKLGRYVAVKVLKPEFRQDATFVKKFRSEAQAAAGLTHPNIVSVFDVGDDEGVYYIVMELIEGITLKEYISKKGRLSVKEATSIAIQVCMGLEAAHNHGIVHRDVKPQNIIISTDGKVKVTDFGIARAASSNTISSNVMGSVHYSSPEQVRGGYSDEKSDIYSLGITLYEMVTGKVPFDGDTTVAIAIKHLQEEMVPPSVYTPELPYSLEQIIYKCTQKSVNRRYDRMEEVIADLKHSLIDPTGDFVRIGPVSSSAKTLVISDRELGEIKSTPKSAKAIEVENVEEGQEPSRTRRKEDLRRRKKKKQRISLDMLLPLLALLAGVALLIGVIVVVGRSAGLIGGNRGGAGVSETPQTQEETGRKDNLVEVPDLVGKTEDEARALTSESHLGLQTLGEEPSVYGHGLISRQEIPAGTMVEAYTTIKYYTSVGSSELTIPSVDGYTGIDAEGLLRENGLNVDIQRIYSQLDDNGYPIVDPGYAYYTEPSSGSIGHVGDTVTLFVSRGVDYGDSAEVPDVVGMQRNEALTTLGKFLNIQVEEQASSTVPAGIVISQSPEAYSYQDPDNYTITLVVSTGQEGVESAAAVQETISADEAVAAATAAGEVWKCTQRLNTPTGYNGGAIRLELVQEAAGQRASTMIVDGEQLTFPYRLDLNGIPGVETGILYLSERIDGAYESLGQYALTFKKVE
ncbi:MAG: Stk1 family PASTA domain-containing Ser/Thr kinase [Blautia sp.]|nr:Stk1 family PASTA domain-containing Ser/Thr kinase [Blautia sp.]